MQVNRGNSYPILQLVSINFLLQSQHIFHFIPTIPHFKPLSGEVCRNRALANISIDLPSPATNVRLISVGREMYFIFSKLLNYIPITFVFGLFLKILSDIVRDSKLTNGNIRYRN
jgi:hypothetical protein